MERFVHENRIREAASSLGAAVFCIEEAVQGPAATDLATLPGELDLFP